MRFNPVIKSGQFSSNNILVGPVVVHNVLTPLLIRSVLKPIPVRL